MSLLLALGLVLSVGACHGQRDDASTSGLVEGTGTMRFTDIEGGCWRIVADAGPSYRPLSLPVPFQQDGLRVRYAGWQRLEPAGFCPGTPLELRRIEVLAE